MPPALEKRPEESFVVDFILSSFTSLSHYRQSGGLGLSPLAFQDVVAYARLVGYTATDDILFFARLVTVCDTLYLQRATDKQKAQSKSKSKGGRHG